MLHGIPSPLTNMSDDEENDAAYWGTDERAATSGVTPKIPPSFDGIQSWSSYEEAVDDWIDITTLDPPKRGPSLKNMLKKDASVYKPLLDRDKLKNPDTGVEYFKATLRPHFIKGAQSVFLWRLYPFLRLSLIHI